MCFAGFSVHCVSCDDQCVLLALLKVQVKTEQTPKQAEDIGGLQVLVPLLSVQGLRFGSFVPLKPSDLFKVLSEAPGDLPKHRQCDNAIVWLGHLVATFEEVRGVVPNLLPGV